MNEQEHDDAGSKNANVKGKEMSERQIIDRGAAARQFIEHLANERDLREILHANHRRAVGVLRPRKKVAGKTSPQAEEKEEEGQPVGKFARLAVHSENNEPNDVKKSESDEDLSREMMDPAQEPAAPEGVLDVENAFIRGLRARTIVHPKNESGHALHNTKEKKDSRPHFHVHERLYPTASADGFQQGNDPRTGLSPIKNFIKHNEFSLIFKS